MKQKAQPYERFLRRVTLERILSIGQHAKGEPSFRILGELNPAALEPYLPSFVRIQRILNKNLPRRENR